MNSPQNQPSMSSKSWRQKAIEEFGLLPLPEELAQNKDILALSEGNDTIWKRYFGFRIQYDDRDEKSNMEGQATDETGGFKREIHEDGDSYASDNGEAQLQGEVWKSLKKEAKKVEDSTRDPKSKKDKNDAELTKMLAKAWVEHTCLWLPELKWNDYSFTFEIQSVKYGAYIFSPFAIPHAISFFTDYNYESKRHEVEFSVEWKFDLISFDQRGNFGPSTSRGETLCGNSFDDPPFWTNRIRWVGVENIRLDNFTPTTIKRIRHWLYGANLKGFDDYDFLRLLFASGGSCRFFPHKCYTIGYSWERSLTWLEHHIRAMCGKLRPKDRAFKPYDAKEDKAIWGQEVMDFLWGHDDYDDDFNEDESQSDDGFEEEEKQRFRNAPWEFYDEEMANEGESLYLVEKKSTKGRASYYW
jgi:hypothetical protein